MLKLFKRKEGNYNPPIDTSHVSDNEDPLEDENDELSNHLGSLSLEATDDQRDDTIVICQEIDLFSASDLTKTPTVVPSNIHFEVMDAKIMTSEKSKYVSYTILLRSTNHDMDPVSIEKRYSSFEQLHTEMRKKHPFVMQGIHFPRKLLSGNFKAKTIAERSRAFEQYLCHLVMIPEVRISHPFAPFFYEDEWRKACQIMLKNEFSLAIYTLRKVFEIQKKLLGDIHADITLTLCTITLCYKNCKNNEQSLLSSRMAIRSIHTNESNEFLVPLLKFCIRTSWTLGKDKKDLETKLASLSNIGKQDESTVSFEELVKEKIMPFQI